MDILLLTSGFIGILIIIFSRYALFGGLMTIVSFLTYFTLLGTGQWVYLILLLFGLSLIALEFIVPSFGIIGVTGTIMTGMGLFMSSASPMRTLLNFSIALLITVVLAMLLIKIGYKTRLGRGLVLVDRLSDSGGFKSYQDDYQRYLHQIGKTTTSLRPVGRAMFDGEEVEVLSTGEMIDASKTVVVYKVEGNKVFVRLK
ncbi:hydrolase [Granulicatella sp. zg-ZJ]|uniref:NfeD family protein n=1 Tax=unclassified Granulicatella TaxID=2630493 RepID=UPI0013C0B482|nr:MULTISPECIES: NfeD family protein [unclassified Granulicatella]MBS4750774.1 hydrolase [Carnobacteriaceae bacterium zg-ZUI78]NEW63177.1 hydrolase [Granulicatella sp. zg-ZJ]NEW66492.1 hydrolase [Granulicatella sp. zg-84]QMI85518.1 hydrolase [Carnobacteriaceae bacterium zg-84]